DGYAIGRQGKSPTATALKNQAFTKGYEQGVTDRNKVMNATAAALAQQRQDQANTTFNEFKKQEAQALSDKYSFNKTQVGTPESITIDELKQAGFDANGLPLVKTRTVVGDPLFVTKDQLRQAGYDDNGWALVKAPTKTDAPASITKKQPQKTVAMSKPIRKTLPQTGSTNNVVAASVGALSVLGALFGMAGNQRKHI
ncbi:LPXTG cell wall anchor domain-containing protein, partial [Lacticaseibacillus camelliae]